MLGDNTEEGRDMGPPKGFRENHLLRHNSNMNNLQDATFRREDTAGSGGGGGGGG